MKKLILGLLVFAMSITGIHAQTVNEVISKYLQSVGGVEKMKAHSSTRAVGKAPTPQGDFPFELLQEKPNKTKITLDIMGQKMVAQAYDGKTAWMLNPFMGETAQKMSDEQAKMVIEQADMEDPFLDYKAKGHEATLEGTEEVQGAPCYKVKLVKFKGDATNESTQVYFFEKETGMPLLVKTFVKAGQQPEQEVDTYFSDYQEIEGGIVMPFKLETKVGGQVVTSVVFEKIILNQDIPDEEFSFPGETN